MKPEGGGKISRQEIGNILKKRKKFFFKKGFFAFNLKREKETRLAVSVSAKQIKLATERNRTKRRIKEIFRDKKDSLGEGLDLVIVIKEKLDYNEGVSILEEVVKIVDNFKTNYVGKRI